MNGVKGEVGYGGLGVRERLVTKEKEKRKEGLQVGQGRHLWYDGCR